MPSPWQTVHFERTVVGAARTLTSTTRMLDALELLQPDPRIGFLFAYDDRSAFRTGVLDLLDRIGADTVPWGELSTVRCDLIVSASENIGGAPPDVPVLVLPHGVGFHKLVPHGSGSLEPADPGAKRRVSGLIPADVLDGRRIVLAVPDPGSVAHLAALAPNVARHALITGDLAWEQIASSAELRGSYRRALGCGDQRLVVVTSTWGPGSQFGTWHDLAAELAAALPADDFRIAQVLHPNVWASLKPSRVRALLRDALDSGVALIPPHLGWQAALVASDLVIGDHGSVAFYAAALGRPLLLAAYGSAEVVSGTPMAVLGLRVPRLLRDRPLLAQINRALADPGAAEVGRIARRTLPMGIPAGERLRSTMYDLLDLVIPPRPARRLAAREPVAERREVTAYAYYAETVDEGGRHPRIFLNRFPAAADRAAGRSAGALRYVVAAPDEPDRQIAEAADVVVAGTYLPSIAAAECADLLRRFPGCSMAAVGLPDGRCLLRLRDRPDVLIAAVAAAAWARDPSKAAGIHAESTVAAAGTYALLVLSRVDDQTALSARIRLGAGEFDVCVEPASE